MSTEPGARASTPLRWAASHPVFLGAVLAAIGVRAFLVLCTPGTYDLAIWEHHVEAFHDIGLLAYYRVSLGSVAPFNHPPAIAKLVEAIWEAARALGLDFGIAFRLVFTCFDLATAWILARLLARDPRRLLLVGLYLLNPIVFLFSAYHGNTDAALAFFALLALLLVARERYALAGIAAGAGISVKWIILLTFPPLLLAVPGLRGRLRFLGAVAATFFAAFGWHLAMDPIAVVNGVFAYGGQVIQTTAGIPVWGWRILVAHVLDVVDPERTWEVTSAILRNNGAVLLCALAAYYALRARARAPLEAARTMAGGWVIFHAFTNYWSFQYLAWAAPLLVFLELPTFVALSLAASLYVGALYVDVTGSLLLLHPWDFVGHPLPPVHVLLLRDLAIATFLFCALRAIWDAARQALGKPRTPARAPAAG